MPEIPAESEQLARSVSAWAETDPNSITRTELGGDLNFSDLEYALTEIVKLSRQLQTTSIETLPATITPPGNEAYDGISSAADEARQFNPVHIAGTGTHPREIKVRIHDRLRKSIERYWKLMPPVAAFALAAHVASNAKDHLDAIERAVSKANDAAGNAKQTAAELTSLLQTGQEFMAKSTVARSAALFSVQARAYRRESRWWLRATLLTVSLLCVAVAVNLIHAWWSQRYDEYDVPMTVAKILAFILILTGTLWCGRVYKSARHNEALNRQRATALRSFQAFLKSNPDEQTKNAILLHAAQAVFQHQSTGFVPDNAESTPQILEMVRVLSPAKSG